MLTDNSKPIFFRKSNLFFLLALIYFLLVSGLPVEAQVTTKKNATSEKAKEVTLFESLKKNPWSNIKGFRSAQFGMNEKSVYRAISKDFNVAKSKVKKATNPINKTTYLEIIVPNLFKTGGSAQVGYIFGYKSKKLIHINVLWGQGAANIRDGQDVVNTANLLRQHFLKKRYKKVGLIANAQLPNNQTIVFRGRDKKGSGILLVLNTVPKQPEGTMIEALNKTSLILSYILEMEKPDVRTVVIEEDEF